MAWKTNRTVVLRKDYENYNFRMPFEMIGQKSRSYISQELEKIHPGFCNTSVFDSHLFLRKGKLFASVVVMDQLVMEKYKAGSRRSLVFEGFNGRAFGGQKKTVLVGILALAFSVLVFLSLGTASVFKVRGVGTEEKNLDPALEYFLVEESVSETDGTEFLNGLSALFDCLFFQKGKMDSLRVSADGIHCHVTNCFPEKVLELKKNPWLEQTDILTGPVSYSEGVAGFNVDIAWLVQEDRSDECSNVERDSSFIEQLRFILLEHGAEIISEDVLQRRITFAVEEKDCEICFMVLANSFQSCGLNVDVESLEILSSGGTVRVDLRWCGTDFVSESQNLFDVLKENTIIFFSEQIDESLDEQIDFPVCEEEKISFTDPVEDQKSLPLEGKLLGKILDSEGKVHSYYRTADGKIIGVEINAESEIE